MAAQVLQGDSTSGEASDQAGESPPRIPQPVQSVLHSETPSFESILHPAGARPKVTISLASSVPTSSDSVRITPSTSKTASSESSQTVTRSGEEVKFVPLQPPSPERHQVCQELHQEAPGLVRKMRWRNQCRRAVGDQARRARKLGVKDPQSETRCSR